MEYGENRTMVNIYQEPRERLPVDGGAVLHANAQKLVDLLFVFLFDGSKSDPDNCVMMVQQERGTFDDEPAANSARCK